MNLQVNNQACDKYNYIDGSQPEGAISAHTMHTYTDGSSFLWLMTDIISTNLCNSLRSSSIPYVPKVHVTRAILIPPWQLTPGGKSNTVYNYRYDTLYSHYTL